MYREKQSNLPKVFTDDWLMHDELCSISAFVG